MRTFQTEDDLGDLKNKIQHARKTVLTKVIRMDEDFMCITREGPLQGYAGDYLAIGAWGEVYPIGSGIFDDTYEIVPENRLEWERDAIKFMKDNRAAMSMKLMLIRSDCNRAIRDPYAGPVVKEFAQKILDMATTYGPKK